MQASLRKNFRAEIVSPALIAGVSGLRQSAGSFPCPCMLRSVRRHLLLKFFLEAALRRWLVLSTLYLCNLRLTASGRAARRGGRFSLVFLCGTLRVECVEARSGGRVLLGVFFNYPLFVVVLCLLSEFLLSLIELLL